MKKSKFIKSTLILIIGGFFTKILGMFIRIVITRLIGTEGIGLYMLISPTFLLFISLSQAGMPISISKLIAERRYNSKRIISNALIISLSLNIIIMFLVIIFSNFLAINLLHEKRVIYSIISIGLTLPFISISSIIRGYFFGKERMIPHVLSNIIEDIVRFIVICLGVPIFIKKGLEFAVAFIVISNIFSELSSIIVLLLFLPKKISINKNDLSINKSHIKNILSISIPTTGSRLIGSIGYFFEPIIMTFCLLKIGYSNSYIINEYGIINGYVMPLILLPSFFTLAISQALIPVISNYYSHGFKIHTKKKIKQAIFFSLLIGIPSTLIFIFIPEIPLKLIYNTNLGINYIHVLAPFCLLHYIQAPISSSLQAMGKAHISMKSTLYGMIIRTILLFILCSIKIGLWGLVISTIANIVFVTTYDAYKINKYLK